MKFLHMLAMLGEQRLCVGIAFDHALECRALRKVRDEMGLRNLKVMVPFCRTVDEGKRVVAAMARNGETPA